MTCQSCSIADYILRDGNLGTCAVLDCNNTDFPLSGFYCNYEFTEFRFKIHAYRVPSDPVPCEGGCNLCGDDGYMTIQGNVTIPGYGAVICEYVQFDAVTGQIPADQCGPLGEAVFSECGCVSPTASLAPQGSPTLALAPAGSGGAAPTTGAEVGPTAAPGTEVGPTSAPSGSTSSLWAGPGIVGLAAATTALAAAAGLS
jgi:hypothetical protein